MSLPSTPRSDAPSPKMMSSRLLTMKFMQRAAASSPLSTPSTEPALKRRKTDHTSTPDSSLPSTPVSDLKLFVDKNDIRAAIKAESAYEALATARRAELGFANNTVETQWVLDVRLPKQNGVDESEEDEVSEDDAPVGRQTYGSFKRKKKTASAQNTPARDKNGLDLDLSDSEDGEVSSDDESDDEHERSARKRKAGLDLDDDEAMSALDRVDLSKSKYAKSKQAGLPYTGAKPKYAKSKQAGLPYTGAKPKYKDAFSKGRHLGDRRGDKHPKKDKGKKMQHKKKSKY